MAIERLGFPSFVSNAPLIPVTTTLRLAVRVLPLCRSNYYSEVPQVHSMEARQSDRAVQSARSRTIKRMLFIRSWLVHRLAPLSTVRAGPALPLARPAARTKFSSRCWETRVSSKVWCQEPLTGSYRETLGFLARAALGVPSILRGILWCRRHFNYSNCSRRCRGTNVALVYKD